MRISIIMYILARHSEEVNSHSVYSGRVNTICCYATSASRVELWQIIMRGHNGEVPEQ